MSFLVPRMYFLTAEEDVEASGTARGVLGRARPGLRRFVFDSAYFCRVSAGKRFDFLLSLYILTVVLPE